MHFLEGKVQLIPEHPDVVLFRLRDADGKAHTRIVNAQLLFFVPADLADEPTWTQNPRADAGMAQTGTAFLRCQLEGPGRDSSRRQVKLPTGDRAENWVNVEVLADDLTRRPQTRLRQEQTGAAACGSER